MDILNKINNILAEGAERAIPSKKVKGIKYTVNKISSYKYMQIRHSDSDKPIHLLNRGPINLIGQKNLIKFFDDVLSKYDWDVPFVELDTFERVKEMKPLFDLLTSSVVIGGGGEYVWKNDSLKKKYGASPSHP